MRKAYVVGIVSVVVLLLISVIIAVAVHFTRKTNSVYTLNMAADSVDDQFTNCTAETNKRIKDEFLPEELKTNKKFGEAWNNYTNINDDFVRIIKVYTYAPNRLYSELNNAVSSSRKNYINEFSYKSFHFLLTRAVQLHKVQNCVDVFRRTSVHFEIDVLDREMRFGRFTSTSFRNNMADTFGTASCFKVHTCFGADISRLSVFPAEEEVLVPPYEKFRITNVEKNMMNCNVLYTLQSSGKVSNMNCELLNAK